MIMTANESNRRIFDTPLSIQRYQWVQKYVEDNPNIRSVTDLGCGNGRLNIYLKSISHLEKLNYMDCDYDLLDSQIEYYFMPAFMELLIGRQNSDKELSIKVYHGDITVPHDILKADCFVMVEVIEHMPLEHVEQATRAIFGYYQPETVIITTPNSEFNHLLRQEGEPPTKFRHFDHKFEWTRSEFRHWAENVCNNFPYTVHYDGVGHLPGSEAFGPCTQIAIFKQITVNEKLDRDSFIRKDGHIKEGERQSDKIRLIGEFLITGCKTPIEPPVYDYFDWENTEGLVIEDTSKD